MFTPLEIFKMFRINSQLLSESNILSKIKKISLRFLTGFRFTLLIISLFFILGWLWQSPIARKNTEGNRFYQKGKLDEALSKYRDAQIENPDSKELHYNIGNALHQNKKYEDSLREHEKALDTKDIALQANAYYNMGNTHYRLGKLLEAIEDYKKCLDINPDDEDAKYNIEFIRKKLKEQLKKEEQKETQAQQQQQTQQAQQQAQQQDSQGEEKPEEEQAKAEEKAKEEASQEEKTGEEKKEQAEGQELEEESKPEEQKEGEMSEEDALRILDATKDDEKDLQRELRRQPIEGEYRVEKDW